MRCKRHVWIGVCFLCLLSTVAAADVRLPRLFSDGMVLQRNRPVPVWGWADPGEEVTVEYANQKKSATSDANGRWMVKLDPLKVSSESQTMTVSSSNIPPITQSPNLQIKNILVGDVFQVSGQSNAAMSLGACLRSPGTHEDIESTTLPQIRIFQVPSGLFKDRPQADVPANCAWAALEPKNNAGFSAVAFYFARALYQRLKIPIGIVRASHGGGRAEIKMSEEALLSYDGGRAFYTAGLEWFKTHPSDRKEDGTVNGRYPSSDWNAAIAPVICFAKSGILWYQGEHNAGDASGYCETLRVLIRSWRAASGDGSMPFIIVQLPAFEAKGDGWPRLREDQLAVYRQTENAGFVVTIDHGEKDNIHPADKKPVGERLALEARRLIYGESVSGCGPLYRDCSIEGARIVVRFTNIGGGLKNADGRALDGFYICDASRHFVPARATITGETVVVEHPQISAPVAVRYLWESFPATVTLFNQDNLPASPFRTDAGEL